MIKNIEQIRQELMGELEKRVVQYCEDMNRESDMEKFPIDKIEKMLGSVIHDSKNIFMDKTEELIENIDEENEIVKKTEYGKKGITLQNHSNRSRVITTIHGKLQISRTMLYSRKTKETVMPKDEYIDIADLPYKMTKAMMCEAALYAQSQSSFKEAAEMIYKAMDIEVDEETVRQVAEYVGGKVHEVDMAEANEAYENIQNIDYTNDRRGVLYIMTDGSAVNTRIEDENGSTWRENKLALIFTDRDLIKRKDGNHIITKKEFAAYIGSVDEFKKMVFAAALRGGYGRFEKVVLIGDGATWIRNMCYELFPDAVQILDKYHLCESIYTYAKEVFNHSVGEYTEWAETIIGKIEKGKIEEVMQMIDETTEEDETSSLKGYIQNNIDKINYPKYEKLGYFVGSGAIESANKVVVQRRLKQAGARWGVTGAQHMVTLRAKKESRRWESDVVGLICAA